MNGERELFRGVGNTSGSWGSEKLATERQGNERRVNQVFILELRWSVFWRWIVLFSSRAGVSRKREGRRNGKLA